MNRILILQGKQSLWIVAGIMVLAVVFFITTTLLNGSPGRVFAQTPVQPAGDFGQPVMGRDLDQLVGLLVEEKGNGRLKLNKDTSDELRNAVLTEMVAMQLTSSLQPLPGMTADASGALIPDEDLSQAFQESMAHAERMRNAMSVVKESDEVGAETRAQALQLHDFLGAIMEAMGEVANQTQNLDPVQAAQELGLCEELSDNCVPNDDIGTVCPNGACDGVGTSPIDIIERANSVGTKNSPFKVRPYFWKQIRSPFFMPFRDTKTPEQDIVATGPLALGECTAIMKEIEGMKVVVRPKLLGYWVEPWYARRHFVGRWVWVWEWLPAELIKTIQYCNNGNAAGQGAIGMDVDVKVIPMPQLRDFWGFFPKK